MAITNELSRKALFLATHPPQQLGGSRFADLEPLRDFQSVIAFTKQAKGFESDLFRPHSNILRNAASRCRQPPVQMALSSAPAALRHAAEN